MDPQLVDRIYESSLVPELWPGVIESLGRIVQVEVGEGGGALLITKADDTQYGGRYPNYQFWAASPRAYDRVKRGIQQGVSWRGLVAARLFAARHAGFMTVNDLLTPAELEVEPLYQEYMLPESIGWIVGTAIPVPTGENVMFALSRQTERGPVGREIIQKLDELRPHLARSVLLTARLQLERARMASETLAALGLPALVLDERGKVMAVNSLIEALPDYVQWRAHDCVSLKDRAADKLLYSAIAAIDVADGGVRSFPVRGTGAEAMMVAHVIPIRMSARDIFVRCAAALVLTPVTLPQAPPVELVQSLFDLTPAEARVARSLAAGETVDGIAAAGGVAQSTVRSQLRKVLEKTGCHRQGEIVALLTGISPSRLTHPA